MTRFKTATSAGGRVRLSPPSGRQEYFRLVYVDGRGRRLETFGGRDVEPAMAKAESIECLLVAAANQESTELLEGRGSSTGATGSDT